MKNLKLVNRAAIYWIGFVFSLSKGELRKV